PVAAHARADGVLERGARTLEVAAEGARTQLGDERMPVAVGGGLVTAPSDLPDQRGAALRDPAQDEEGGLAAGPLEAVEQPHGLRLDARGQPVPTRGVDHAREVRDVEVLLEVDAERMTLGPAHSDRLLPGPSDALEANHLPRRPPDHARVERSAAALQVEEIVGELQPEAVPVVDVALLDLGPAGEPRPHGEAMAEQRKAVDQLGVELGALGARADEAHVAAQHVPQLRNLVDARAAQEATHPRDARIAHLGERRARVLGAFDHAAQLPQREALTGAPEPHLPEEHRAGR